MRIINELILGTKSSSGVITGADASVDQTSLHGLLAHMIGFSIQAVITGTAAGTIKLQGSSDPVPDARFDAATFPVSNWQDILDSSEPVTGAGVVDYNVQGTFYNWVRVVYTASSGTGTIAVTFNAKGF